MSPPKILTFHQPCQTRSSYIRCTSSNVWPSGHFRAVRGAWRAHVPPPPVFGRSVNPISTGGHIIPTTLLRAPPRIFRSCDGPAFCTFLTFSISHQEIKSVIDHTSENKFTPDRKSVGGVPPLPRRRHFTPSLPPTTPARQIEMMIQKNIKARPWPFISQVPPCPPASSLDVWICVGFWGWGSICE